MAGSFTDYLAHKLLDLAFGSAAFTPPATLYFGLSLAPASKAGTVTEPAGGGYARVAVTNDATRWPAAATRGKANGALVTFPAPSGAWGTVLSFFIADASTGGNVLISADLATPRTLGSGSPAPKFAIGAVTIQHS